MKKLITAGLALAMAATLITASVAAGGPGGCYGRRGGNCTRTAGVCAYVDADGDGVCDNCKGNFVDADGDGICDNHLCRSSGQGNCRGVGRGCRGR